MAIAIGISRQAAIASARRADASKLLAFAELRFVEDPTEALALATASLELADTPEARTFVMKTLWESPPAFELIGGSSVKFPAFSPDGKSLAAAGHATDARVWSEDGRGPIVLGGLDPTPRGGNLARWASSDLLVTGPANTFGSRVFVWSLPTGERLRTIDFGRPSVWQVGPRSLLVRTAEGPSADHNVLLRSWRLPDGEAEVLGRVNLAGLGARASAFEPDGGSLLYVKGRDIFALPLPAGATPGRVFDRLGAGFVTFGAGTDPLVQADNADLDRLVVTDAAGETRIFSYDAGAGPERRVVRRPGPPGTWMSPDRSRRWMVGDVGREQMARVWNLGAWADARPLQLRRSGSWYIAQADVHPSGDWLVASTASLSRLTFWPLHRTYPWVVEGYSAILRPLAFSPDGKWLATGWGDGRLRLWPLPGSGESQVRVLELPQNALWSGVSFEAGGRFLFAVGNEGHAWVVPLDGSPARRLEGFSKDTLLPSAAISPSGRRVATAFDYGQGEKVLRVWDLETGDTRRFDLPASGALPVGGREPARAPTGYERGVSSLAFSDESTLYSAGDGGLRRWNLSAGTQELVAPGAFTYASFDRAAQKLLLLVMRELPSRGGDCQARIYDTKDGTSRPFHGTTDCGNADPGTMALDSSARVAVTGDSDGVVRIQRLDGGEVHVLAGHRGAVSFVAVSPDLRWVATAGEDGTLRLWPMPDLAKPPLHALPLPELIATLRSLTNLRAVRDPASATGWKIEVGPFPGWRNIPTW